MSYDLGTAHGKITLDYDGHGAAKRAEEDMDDLSKNSKKTDKSVSSLGKTLGTLGGIAKKVALGGLFLEAAVGASALAIHILGIIPNLVSILSLSSALPGLFVGMIAAVSVLKVAFSGVGDAVKAAFDPSKAADFQKALEKLSPSAQAFVKVLHSAAPDLQAYGRGIQEAFFSSAQLAQKTPGLISILARLQPQVRGLASEFGNMTSKLLDFVKQRETVGFVGDAITEFQASVEDASSVLTGLLTGLRNVGETGLPLILRLADAATSAAGKFGDWLTAISSDGRLNTWIAEAIDTLKTLGGIVVNIGSILFSVISTANKTGGGFLNTLEGLTGQLATFLKSTDGLSTLTALFSAILSVAKPLGPIITTAASALVKALGPAIQIITGALGPALLTVVQNLAPALAPLANAIAGLVTAIIPLLGPVSELVQLFAKYLATAVTQLVSELAPLISLFSGALLSAFQDLAPVLDDLAANVLPQAAALGAQLATAFAPLVPLIVQLGAVFAGALTANLPRLTSAFAALVPQIVQLATVLSQGLVKFLTALIPLIPTIVSGFITFATIMSKVDSVILGVITKLIQFDQFLASIPSKLSALGNAIGSAISSGLTTAYNFLNSIGNSIINFFVALPGRILAGLRALPGLLAGLFKAALLGAVYAIGFAAGLIVGAVTKLPGDIVRAVRVLGPELLAVIRSAWNSAVSATVSGVNSAIAFARSLPSKVRSAVSALGGYLRSVASSAWSSLRSAFNTGVNNAVSLARSLPGKIRSAVGNLGSILSSAGHAIINGLINGIQSGIGRALGMVRNLGGQIKGAFNDALKIFSPSRVFFQSGVYINEGLIKGIQSKLADVKRVAQSLANTVINPTIAVPSTAAMAVAAVPTIPAIKATAGADGGSRDFGPYELKVDQGTLTKFTIDAVTGAPKAVAAAAKEGDRQGSWTGSGRSN